MSSLLFRMAENFFSRDETSWEREAGTLVTVRKRSVFVDQSCSANHQCLNGAVKAPAGRREQRPGRLMSSAFRSVHPEGMFENSPAFQRWESGPKQEPSPEGTVESLFSRPFGTDASANLNPALKRRAIPICPFGTPRAKASGNDRDGRASH